MRWIGAVIALSCIPAVLLAPWVDLPFPHRLNGAAFSLFSPLAGQSKSALIWISFGSVSAVLLAFAAVASIIWRPIYLCACGALLIVIAYLALLHLALGDAPLLLELAHAADWERAAVDFTKHYISPGITTEPGMWPELSFETVQDRLASGWYFLGLGWYIATVCGIWIFWVGIRSSNKDSAKIVTSVAVAFLAVITCLVTIEPLAAQWSFVKAVNVAGEGRSAQAIVLYNQAIRLDGWYARNIRMYERIGALDAQLGRKATPDFNVYYAETLLSQTENILAETQPPLEGFRAAIGVYDNLAEHGPICELARKRAAELMTEYGVQLFANGAFGSAVYSWRQALIRDPNMWLAKFYLSRGYLDVGNYERAAHEAGELIASISDPVLQSVLFIDLGDAYMELGDLKSAHIAYYKSYALNYDVNQRGLASLIGE